LEAAAEDDCFSTGIRFVIGKTSHCGVGEIARLDAVGESVALPVAAVDGLSEGRRARTVRNGSSAALRSAGVSIAVFGVPPETLVAYEDSHFGDGALVTTLANGAPSRATGPVALPNPAESSWPGAPGEREFGGSID
jgi:hypothetical protein